VPFTVGQQTAGVYDLQKWSALAHSVHDLGKVLVEQCRVVVADVAYFQAKAGRALEDVAGGGPARVGGLSPAVVVKQEQRGSPEPGREGEGLVKSPLPQCAGAKLNNSNSVFPPALEGPGVADGNGCAASLDTGGEEPLVAQVLGPAPAKAEGAC